MAKRVLLISPYFPPHNTIGTKRAVNFVQGVHGQEDWEVIVLASKPFKDEYDFRLSHCVPEGVKAHYEFVGIFRPLIKLLAQGFNRKNRKKPNEEEPQIIKKKTIKKKRSISLTPFDQYVWDVNSAIYNGKKLMRQYKPDVIWVNADPWSGFLVAAKLSRKFGVPWVADLRDPWTVFEKKMQWRPTLTVKIIRWYEKRFFSSASKVVLNTEIAYEAYKSRYPSSFSNKFMYIRNAYNECLLREFGLKPDKKAFTFGYYGGFRDLVPSDDIIRGLADLIKKHDLDPSEVRFEVRGNVYPEFWDQVNEHKLEEYVSVEKEINLGQTITLLRSWDALLISAAYDRRWMIPAKFYDYLFARKPIIAISNNKELNRLINETKSGRSVETKKPDEILALFEAYFKKGKSDLIENQTYIEPYGLDKQAIKFRETLNEVMKS
ncbi:Glycosyltransferase Family 4 [Ekhidna lutea]|uniref:Glycosyltransferase Family 4 n=1 Tax=Ekhidna lutea TaxID=447679 RepID=A0A239FQF1_EKHLU|nr:glycosyltransferase [Ekhidna lutea]SNS59019.1 Glycosyltransferase Family 4 [Ekhidna lutea]